MWTSFFLACLLFGVILYVPGILVLGPFFRSNGMGLFPVLAAAPIVTLFPLAVLSELFGYMGIPMNAWVVVLFAACLCFAGLLVGSRRAGRSALTTEEVKKDISVVVAYVAIGCVVAGVIYVKSMDGPAPIFPEFDNASHLAIVRVFADSGKWSSLQSSLYLPSELGILTSAGSTGFYPSLWHACCAFLVDFLSVSVPVAINAVNAVAVSVVFPLLAVGLHVFIRVRSTSAFCWFGRVKLLHCLSLAFNGLRSCVSQSVWRYRFACCNDALCDACII